MCYRLHVLQVTCATGYMCYRLHVLQVTCATGYMCYRLHVLQVTCATGYMFWMVWLRHIWASSGLSNNLLRLILTSAGTGLMLVLTSVGAGLVFVFFWGDTCTSSTWMVLLSWNSLCMTYLQEGKMQFFVLHEMSWTQYRINIFCWVTFTQNKRIK